MQLPQRIAESVSDLVEHICLISEPQLPCQCSYTVVNAILPHMVSCGERNHQGLTTGGASTSLHGVHAQLGQALRYRPTVAVMQGGWPLTTHDTG